MNFYLRSTSRLHGDRQAGRCCWMISSNFLNSTGVLVFIIFAGENNLIEEQSEIVNLDPGLRESEAGVGSDRKKFAF